MAQYSKQPITIEKNIAGNGTPFEVVILKTLAAFPTCNNPTSVLDAAYMDELAAENTATRMIAFIT